MKGFCDFLRRVRVYSTPSDVPPSTVQLWKKARCVFQGGQKVGSRRAGRRFTIYMDVDATLFFESKYITHTNYPTILFLLSYAMFPTPCTPHKQASRRSKESLTKNTYLSG
jgi:hypothetical protein